MSADHDHEHAHDHDGQEIPSATALRVKALESLLVEKGLVDPAALDAVVDAFETKIGPRNGARVVARARVFLDEAFPIAGASHADVRRYYVKDGALLVDDMPLVSPEKFAGYRGNPKAPDAILLRNNGLHVELVFDRAHPIGARDQALLEESVAEIRATGGEASAIALDLREPEVRQHLLGARAHDSGGDPFVRAPARRHHHPRAAPHAKGIFFASARNWASPTSVSGCLTSCLITLSGSVATCAPISAACTKCTGCRTLAVSTCVSKP